jgi:hypothetical protein
MSLSAGDSPPVRVIKPGKRALSRLRAAAVAAVAEALEETPSRPAFVTTDDPYAFDAIEAAERAKTMSVALAQPHRRGFSYPASPWLASPLGQFCKRSWPEDHAIREVCYRAGNDYGRDVRAARVARGFFVDGINTEARGEVPGGGVSDDEVMSAKCAIEDAETKVRGADEVLRAIFPRLPRAMEKLCCSLESPGPYDAGILQAGLWRLAGHYGLLDRGINSTKDF